MSEPITPEAAALMGQDPFVEATKPKDRVRAFKLMKLAREYVVDFDLLQATARAGLEWKDTKMALRDPFFVALVREIVEMSDPDAIIQRNELLSALKREAFQASKPSDRINALNSLARLTGMELPTKQQLEISAPSINLTVVKKDE
jgi:hypothetical protein